MDTIASLFMKVGGNYVCKKCNHQTNRLENIKRHIEDTHLKMKVTCECGKRMAKSSLSRHKRLSCKPLTRTQSESTPIFTVSVKEFTVDSFKIKLITSSDGSRAVLHDPVQVDGYPYNLSPTKTSEINLIEDMQMIHPIGYVLKSLIFFRKCHGTARSNGRF